MFLYLVGIILFCATSPLMIKRIFRIIFFKHEVERFVAIVAPTITLLSAIISAIVCGVTKANLPFTFYFIICVYVSFLGLALGKVLLKLWVKELPQELLEHPNYAYNVQVIKHDGRTCAIIPEIEEPVPLNCSINSKVTNTNVIWYYRKDWMSYYCFPTSNLDNLRAGIFNILHFCFILFIYAFFFMSLANFTLVNQNVYTEHGNYYHKAICSTIINSNTYSERKLIKSFDKDISDYKPCKVCKPSNSAIMRILNGIGSILLTTSLYAIIYFAFSSEYYMLAYNFNPKE